MPKLTINNFEVEVPVGATILDAAKKLDIKIPTLCYLEGCRPVGACRVCLVEAKGFRDPVTACSTPVSEGMQVFTNSSEIRRARKAVVELLLSEHDGDCQVCDRNNDCELQKLAGELGISRVPYPGEKAKRHLDESTPALVRDSAKCINCRRCIEICGQIQGVGSLFPQGRGYDTYIGPAFGGSLSDVTCVQCGQCAAACPVGAISERDQVEEVWQALDDPNKFVVVQTAPAIRAALGECFGNEPGTLVTGKMTTALRSMGFDAVFDTNFTADLTIMEEGTELLTRLKKALVDKDTSVALPMFTSCSPGWINYAESFYPEFLPNLSTCKSPQQMFGAVAKTYYAEKIGKDPKDIVVVSIMPCTAKKFEAQRPEMNDSGVTDVDIVLTTRELGKMIKQAALDFNSLPDSEMDAPLGVSTGAADIFANTGGVMEAALRTVYEIVTGKDFPFPKLHVAPVAGLEGVKEASVKLEGLLPEWSFLEGVEVKLAVAHGLSNAKKVLEKIKSGEATYHFIEVMCCPGGCIGGGGQPRFTDNDTRLARIEAIYREDEGRKLRKSHHNPAVQEIYKEFLKEPLGKMSHKLLHTHYKAKEKV
jgi:iron-only hydrogenase group A